VIITEERIIRSLQKAGVINEKELIMGVKVLLDSVDKVRDFVDITRSAPYDIDLISGRNTYLDAKSLLGVLSCDCRKPLILDIHAELDEREELMTKIEKYVVA
jgi:phosphotransferase system HPr-like phosphotransfer protein